MASLASYKTLFKAYNIALMAPMAYFQIIKLQDIFKALKIT